ncbi:alpha-L-fucosidase [Bacteroides sp. 224]|uniref:alpha-L-fucosidase n=1 Tax=Bacteroides sp. 224 TaxID=2302936 RepID=UPI0013D22376|nr:alpha-L-fucosidase [Bacteroides sp. 224]NDV65601.1 alpha-L-fucosidase [Bacteroides sp. 224]
MKKKAFYSLLLAVIFPAFLSAQDQGHAHGMSKSYTWPTEKGVLEKLDKWQDLKFGMIIHYGLYSELGIVESWSICAEEADWIPRDSTICYDEYKRQYWSTIDRFNPVKLDPESWARYGKEAGMKYVVFTTKHHDGFAMFDTKYSDFSITKGAFKDHPRSNIAKEVFNAFRNDGYMIGAYFSKPDWHSQYFWWDRYATPNRRVNYNIAKNPWRWKQFEKFTYNQIEELMNGDYGSIDILWLDGGWVRPERPGERERLGTSFLGAMEIDMDKIAAMARSYQPNLLMVDRTIAGKNENYQTPEQGIPDKQLNNPWESCITLGKDWGFTPNDPYKSSATVIHKLVEIVAKGGSLLLGIGPKPDGTLPNEVVDRLKGIGEWTSQNGKAIYGTRNAQVYNDGNTWFTQSKDGKKIYSITCLTEGEAIPETISWKGWEPKKGSAIRYVPTGQKVKWTKTNDGDIVITLPKGIKQGCAAVAFEVTPAPSKQLIAF